MHGFAHTALNGLGLYQFYLYGKTDGVLDDRCNLLCQFF